MASIRDIKIGVVFRTERQIKAEALREAAAAWLHLEDDPSDPVYRFLMERADHLCEGNPV